MQQAKILTIAVPSYNMEAYLPHCLDSMPKDARLEVLVVNDGSTDATLALARGYEAKWPATFRVIDKPNGNYGSCVNRALAEATGQYVKVVDADDSVETASLAALLDALEQTEADLVLTDFEVVNEAGAVTKTVTYPFATGTPLRMTEVCTTPEFMAMEMHAVAYRTGLLRSIGYRQSEGISYTDQQWIFHPMAAVETVVYYQMVVYRYLVGRQGQTMEASVKLRRLSHLATCSLHMASVYETKCFSKCEPHADHYLKHRLTLLIKEVYVTSLLHYDRARRKALCAYDADLWQRSEYVHQLVGSREASSFLGFRYLDCWRRHHGASPRVVSCLSHLYMMILRLKKRCNGKG